MPSGDKVDEANWQASPARAVAVFLNGSALSEPDPRGDPITDKKFLLLFNSGPNEVAFTVPGHLHDGAWEIVLDTSGRGRDTLTEANHLVLVQSHSVYILRGAS
jgi:isoamylase